MYLFLILLLFVVVVLFCLMLRSYVIRLLSLLLLSFGHYARTNLSCISLLLQILINFLKLIIMSENKKSPWLIVLTIAKYAIAVIIGALGGNSDTVTNILNF